MKEHESLKPKESFPGTIFWRYKADVKFRLTFITNAMHESLIKYINSYISTPLNNGQEELIRNTLAPKKIRKRQYLLQEGQVCKYAAFIVKGAMRQYSVDDKGVEHIVNLFIENWWANDRESFVMLTPSIYNAYSFDL